MTGARRVARPAAKGTRRGAPTFGGRPPARVQRKPAKRKGRVWRLRRSVERHPYLFKALRFSLLAVLWGGIVLGGAVVYFISQVPDPILATLDDRPPNLTILAADGTVLAERGLRRGHVRLEKLPPYLINAVIATEDRRFYSHFGIDPIGLARAMVRNAVAGSVIEGGSTITQQLAKNLFLKPDRTIKRKLEELIYAIWLEQRFNKDEILELYLNRVYFGGGTYGVEAAARYYFDKSARAVTLPQAALLAGLLKAPSRYAPTNSVSLASTRLDDVLDKMVDAGFLTEEEARAAQSQPLGLRARDDVTGYPYAVDWVAEVLPTLVGEPDGDLIVDTTIDAKIQRNAQSALRNKLDTEGAHLRIGEGAIVVLDRAGGVKALVGGRSYWTSPFDRALKGHRQPGSAFKPFVYLAALESGYTPDSVETDQPISVAGWVPKNYTNRYRGVVSLRQAMADSINTVAVKLAADVGLWRVTRTARRLGIQSKLHDNPSIALGTAEVTPIELTGAYVPFANGGYAVTPHIIARVRNGEGAVLYRRKERPQQVVALAYVGAMNDMMNAGITRGTGAAAAIPLHIAAGKTGTSQASRDAWFVGYTAHYVAGIWVGNDDNSPMKKVTGGTVPAELWHEIMVSAHETLEPRPLPGTRMPGYTYSQDEIAQLPAQQRPPGNDQPLFRRVFGILTGN